MLDTPLTMIPIETWKVRDLLMGLVETISPIAKAAGRYSVTDKDVDTFTAEVCAAACTETLKIQTIRQYMDRADQVRSRVLTLYRWACEALCRAPKSFDTPALSPKDDIPTLAGTIRENEMRGRKERGTESWEALCIKKLGAFASILTSAAGFDTNTYNPYAFLHKAICSLAEKPSVFELAALIQLIEKETLILVNLMVAGDTLVDLPSLHSAVRTSKIVVIDKSPPRRRVRDDRV